MDKRRAIQIMTKAAQLYKENLEDQKVLFLYGLPREVKKQLQEKGKILSSVQGYEVAFHRYNFLHLTGVRLNKKTTASAIHFYQKCLDKRLTENDFSFAKDGSTGQKLDILERMMLIKKNATVTVCHTRTVDMPSVVKEADIVIVAAGRAGVVDDTYLREGQVVIDVGINVNAEGKLCGDVNFEEAEKIVDAITPVPRGVGGVTTSILLEHVVDDAIAQNR